jgi:hypothetical protein
MPQCQFPVFCCFCVSEKLNRKYSRNWTKQIPNLLFFSDTRRRPKENRRGARDPPHQGVARPFPPWPWQGVVGPLATLWHRLSAYLRPSKAETLNRSVFFQKEFRSSPPPPMTFGGHKSLFQNTARTGKCPRSHLYQLHHLHRWLYRLHRHLHWRCCLPWWGGSSSSPGLRALPVAMWFISLSHDVIYMWSWAIYIVELVDAILHILCYSSALLL